MMSVSRKLLGLLGVFLAASCIASGPSRYRMTFDELQDSVRAWNLRRPIPNAPRIFKPSVPPEIRLAKLIKVEALRAGIDADMLAAVIQHESGGDSLAVNPSDPSYGLGQVMPRWWQHVFVEECGDEATPETLMRSRLNVCYTAHILAYAHRRFGGDRSSAISYYNTGDPHRGRSNGYNDSVESLMASAD